MEGAIAALMVCRDEISSSKVLPTPDEVMRGEQGVEPAHQEGQSGQMLSTPAEAQQALSEIFRCTFQGQNAAQVAAVYNEFFSFDIISSERVQVFFEGRALLNRVEFACFGIDAMPLRHSGGEKVEKRELALLCEETWHGERKTEYLPLPGQGQDTLNSEDDPPSPDPPPSV